MQIQGVNYLEKLFSFTKVVAEYTSDRISQSKNTDKKNQIIKLIDILSKERLTLYGFKNDLLAARMSKIRNFNYTDEEYYEYLDLVNLENYTVGNKAELHFENDHKLYFLNSLITHYLPEYLISVSITNNILREKLKGILLSQDVENLFIEQNKLVQLSTEEVDQIINFLKEYEDTQILRNLISDSLKILSKQPSNLGEQLAFSNKIYDLSNQLNVYTFNITKKNYNNRKVDLEEKILFNQLIFIFIFIVITILVIYFWFVFKANKQKAREIVKLNESLDKLVIFSTTDVKGVITNVSSAMLDITGYREEDVIGQTHAIFKHSDMSIDLYKDLWKTILNKETWVGDIKNIKKDGSSWWAKTTIIPELNKYGEIVSFVSYRFDISYQKEVEVEKIKTQEALSFKSKFLSNMPHEIRTPLNGIVSITDVVLKTELDENQKNLLLKMKSTSDILLGVINDILDISKIESGKMTIENEPLNLKDLVVNVQYIVSPKAKDKGLEVNVDFKAMKNFNFRGDSLRISQVLTNLIGNAIKFTSEGSVTLHVTKKGGNTVLFEVTDTGIGFKHSVLDTLFNEFTQADMSTSREYGGTGLGLSISKNLVELMGGKIWVDSIFGEGSTFSFTLELEECDNYNDMQEKTLEDKELIESKVNSLENVNILVAEDNKMNQMVLAMLLEDSNINIEFADDGLIAFTKFKESQYDLILMDIQMPVMNGYDATQKIREFDENIPIVALSANVLQEDIDKAFAAGMNDYLSKPIDVHKLYEALLKYIKH